MGAAILVAEDNAVSRELLVFQLGLLGCEATAFDNGAAAAAAWRSGHYAMLLTDLQMPGLDGYGLASLIRDEEGDERMPIVALTAGSGEADTECDAARRAACGMDACMTKPPSLAALRAAVERWVGTATRATQPASAHEPRRVR
ncbi:MAG: response regulator [Caldimonas sp.]